MSELRPITTTDNNNKGQVVINWTQVSDDAIQYDTDDKETMMAKAKERMWCKAAEQAWQEEQAQLEAERVERERAAHEAKEERAHEEERRHRSKEEREAKAGSSEAAGVKKVVMDPSCTCCTQAKTVFKGQALVACRWEGQKDTEASPKIKVNKGKKQKADDEMPEPGLSQKKQVKLKPIKVLEINEPKASGSRARKAMAGGLLGLEDKLEWLIDITGLIANNLVGLFELQEAVVKNSGCIADVLEAIINESYGFRLDLDELHEEVEWLQAKGEEEEAEGGDESMAEAE
ncbi:hypothetical protein M404DRAFT_34474 [Pisolithus tinctorius Marx 270]|uniref:Uncharacterized protein n=1 Tax=Pisolithus tinctorius Marx 270 TaxID=870435 RepID=A0A0C3NH90_PISTI|nr:hypothetical protein M404DRAFT_34474 [Pisolithus tinctorius Marx 270]